MAAVLAIWLAEIIFDTWIDNQYEEDILAVETTVSALLISINVNGPGIFYWMRYTAMSR